MRGFLSSRAFRKKSTSSALCSRGAVTQLCLPALPPALTAPSDSLPARLGEFLTSSTRPVSPKDSLLRLAPRTLVGKDGHYGHPELKVFAVHFTKGSCKSERWVQLGYTTRDWLRTWHFR